jgi:Tfp pilus assembly protein PilE
MAMHNAAILERENKELKTANAKQKRKRETRRTYISQGEGLTIKEEMNRVRRANKAERQAVKQADPQPRKRAVQQCSMCGILGHTARTCSQRTGNSS